jgi:hypothetical protein
MIPFKDCVWRLQVRSKMRASRELRLTLDTGETHSKIFSSETTWPTGIKLGHHSPWSTIFTVFRHLGSDLDLPDTILKGDHPRTIVTKLDSSWLGGFREEDLWMCFSRGSNVNLGSTWTSYCDLYFF